MWAYLVFALVCVFARGRYVEAMLALALLCGIWLALDGDIGLNRTYSGSLPRCLYGFGLGVLACRLHRRGTVSHRSRSLVGLIEVAALAGVVAFVSIAEGVTAMAGPVVFMVAVIIFSAEAGAVSHWLSIWPLRQIGTLSYSIYMIHVFVLGRLSDVYQAIAMTSGVTLLESCKADNGKECFSGSQPVIWGTAMLFVVILIFGAWLIWRIIEEPGRRWSRRFVANAAARRAARTVDEHGAF